MAQQSHTSDHISRRQLLTALGGTVVVGAIATPFGFDTNRIEVNEDTLHLDNFDADGIKIAVISDLHSETQDGLKRCSQAFDLASRAKPDVVVMPGDFATRGYEHTKEILRQTFELMGMFSCPVLVTHGNHDYGMTGNKRDGRKSRVIEAMRHSNVIHLPNQIHKFQGLTFWGIDDAVVGNDRYDYFDGAVPKNTVVLLHEPDVVDRVPKGCSLMISGHTHGGQICLPFGIPITGPPLGKKYFSGFYSHTPTALFVSKGIGVTTGFRYCCPPEVNILTLRRA
ncbi:MAG: metallophosphoesterase [Armatimonadetes bacterium]|nr:metallophosphoesterase [Armatimonadota bacterium]